MSVPANAPPHSPRGLFGFKPSILDERTLHLDHYRSSGQVYDAPAPIQNWRQPAMTGMWWNDSLNDCTVAAICARIQQLCAMAGITCTLTLDEARAFYFSLTGGADDGLMPIEVLTRLNAAGIGKDAWLKGCTFARVDIQDPVKVRAALWGFGFVYLGANLPKRIDSTGSTWKRPPLAQQTTALDSQDASRGHCFGLYSAEREELGFYTWSEDIASNDDWLSCYGIEGWMIKDPLWSRSRNGVAPNGYDDARLEADLAGIMLVA